jgi:PAS domain S-box-containing protein
MTLTLSKDSPLAAKILGPIALGFAYLVLAKLGLTIASLHPSASPVWPPSGLALAACLLWGSRAWPAIGAGALIANATTFGSMATSSAIAVGNTLEAVLTARLVDRWCTSTEIFEIPSRVAIFAALTLAPGTMISATTGVGSLVFCGYADATDFSSIWWTWWLGDVGGQVLVTPAIVLWAQPKRPELESADLQEWAALLAATVTVGLLAFSPLFAQTPMRGSWAFLAIIPILWAALRHGQRETASTALVLSTFAIWGTLANGGPFARPSLNDSFLLTLIFVISITVPSLILSADVAARRFSEERYRGLVEEANDIVATLDLNLNIITANPAAERLLGYAPQDLVGTSLRRYVREGQLPKYDGKVEQRLRGKRPPQCELELVGRTGRPVTLEVNPRLVVSPGGDAVEIHVVARDVSERKEAEARQKLFVRELQHRAKNLLAVVQSTVNNTLVRSRDLTTAREAIAGRLEALARAQDFAAPGNAAGMVPLRDLVASELSAFGARMTMDGASVAIGSAFAQKLALLLHELATNAAKYGALSSPDGRVRIAWAVEQQPADREPRLRFSWVERGGPRVEPPAETGFGMQLISAMLQGAQRVSFAPDGLTFAFDVPFSEAMRENDPLRSNNTPGSDTPGLQSQTSVTS